MKILRDLEVMVLSGNDHRYLGLVLGGLLAQEGLPEILTLCIGKIPLSQGIKDTLDLFVDNGIEVRVLKVVVEKKEFGFINYGELRKKTIQKVRGEYLTLLDDDNVFCSNALEILYNEATKGKTVMPRILQHNVYTPLPFEFGVRYITGELNKPETGVLAPIYGLTTNSNVWLSVLDDLDKYIIMEDGIIFARLQPLVVKAAKLWVLRVRLNEDIKRIFSAINYYGWIEQEVKK